MTELTLDQGMAERLLASPSSSPQARTLAHLFLVFLELKHAPAPMERAMLGIYAQLLSMIEDEMFRLDPEAQGKG